MQVSWRGVVMALALVAFGVTGVWAQQPSKGNPVTVTGRIVDNVCWLTMGQKGEGHELRVVFVSSEGQRWEASRAVRV